MSNIVKVCSKHDVLLEKNKSTGDYIVSFSVKNDNVFLRNIANYSFFKILSDINRETLEDVIIETDDSNPDVANMYFLFKPIAKEFGIMGKCMSVNTIKSQHDDLVSFESKDINYTPTPDNMKKYGKITCNYSKLDMNIVNEHLLHIKYVFNVDIHEDLPIYMRNMIGLMMKKFLLESKVFIENIK